MNIISSSKTLQTLITLSPAPTAYSTYREDSLEPDLEDDDPNDTIVNIIREKSYNESFENTKQLLKEVDYEEDVITESSWEYLLC
jgi:hypothetical protein